MRIIFGSIVIMLLLVPSILLAETKEIISEGTYNMGDGETPSVAESRALLKAKQIALEQAGTYVESYSKVKNITLTEDEIQILASGLMEVEILDKKRTVVGDGINFWVKIKAKVSPDKMDEMVKKVKEKSVVEDYKRIQADYVRSQKEIEVLKKQLAASSDKQKRNEIEADIVSEEMKFQAKEWHRKGKEHWLRKEYDDALAAFTGAISLMSGFAEAYNGRGVTYIEKNQYDRAIKDFDSAIALNSAESLFYVNRGNAYSAGGEQDRSIEDYDRAVALAPKSADAYSGRGLAYAKKDDYDKAIKDFSRALSIEQKDDYTLYLRGLAYIEKKQFNKAIVDFTAAIVLNPNSADAYDGRGMAYDGMKQYGRAIKDYSLAIILNPKDVVGMYYSRGIDYGRKGDFDLAINDFNAVILRNPNDSEAYFHRGLVYSKTWQLDKSSSDYQKACEMGHEGGCKGLQINKTFQADMEEIKSKSLPKDSKEL